MSAERLSEARLAEIRRRATLYRWDSELDLLAHIDAQQAELDRLTAHHQDAWAEIDRLQGQVAALHRVLEETTHAASCLVEDCAECGEIGGAWIGAARVALTKTKAVAREHNQRLRLEGARELQRRYDDFLNDRGYDAASRYTSFLSARLADMEREVRSEG